MPTSDETVSSVRRAIPPANLMRKADETQVWIMTTLTELAASLEALKGMPSHVRQIGSDMSQLRGEVSVLKTQLHDEVKSLHERLDPVSSGYTRMDEKWNNQGSKCDEHKEALVALERKVDKAAEVRQSRAWSVIMVVITSLATVVSGVAVYKMTKGTEKPAVTYQTTPAQGASNVLTSRQP